MEFDYFSVEAVLAENQNADMPIAGIPCLNVHCGSDQSATYIVCV